MSKAEIMAERIEERAEQFDIPETTVKFIPHSNEEGEITAWLYKVTSRNANLAVKFELVYDLECPPEDFDAVVDAHFKAVEDNYHRLMDEGYFEGGKS